MVNRTQKIEIGKNLAEKVGSAKNAIIYRYSGIACNDMNQIRKDLRESNISAHCAGNFIQKYGLNQTNLSRLYNTATLKESNILVYFEDMLFNKAAAVLKSEQLSFVAGILDGDFVFEDQKVLKELCKLGSTEELLLSFLSLAVMPAQYLFMFIQHYFEELEKGVDMSRDIIEQLKEKKTSAKALKVIEGIFELNVGEAFEAVMNLKDSGLINFGSMGGSGGEAQAAEAAPAKELKLYVNIISTEGASKLPAIQWLRDNIESCASMSAVDANKVLKEGGKLDKIYTSQEDAKKALDELTKFGIKAEII